MEKGVVEGAIRLFYPRTRVRLLLVTLSRRDLKSWRKG